MKKILLLLVSMVLLTSCAVKVPLSNDYLNKPSKVGIWVNVSPATKYRDGSQGLLDLALTSGDKYEPPLKLATEKLNPKENLLQLYSDLLTSKGKEVVIINDEFDRKNATRIKSAEKAYDNKKYFSYDLKNLKEKYGVDEVLFVDVNWGLMIGYYSMIETDRSGFARFDTSIVNTTDNSLYLSHQNIKLNKIKGKWKTPPEYENIISTIKQTLEDAIEEEKTIFKQ